MGITVMAEFSEDGEGNGDCARDMRPMTVPLGQFKQTLLESQASEREAKAEFPVKLEGLKKRTPLEAEGIGCGVPARTTALMAAEYAHTLLRTSYPKRNADLVRNKVSDARREARACVLSRERLQTLRRLEERMAYDVLDRLGLGGDPRAAKKPPDRQGYYERWRDCARTPDHIVVATGDAFDSEKTPRGVHTAQFATRLFKFMLRRIEQAHESVHAVKVDEYYSSQCCADMTCRGPDGRRSL